MRCRHLGCQIEGREPRRRYNSTRAPAPLGAGGDAALLQQAASAARRSSSKLKVLSSPGMMSRRFPRANTHISLLERCRYTRKHKYLADAQSHESRRWRNAEAAMRAQYDVESQHFRHVVRAMPASAEYAGYEDTRDVAFAIFSIRRRHHARWQRRNLYNDADMKSRHDATRRCRLSMHCILKC